MTRVLLDELIETDYGQFDLVWHEDGGFDGQAERFFDGQVNGWVGASEPHGIYVVLARRSGGSQVLIVLHENEPASADESWEDVVEVSALVADGGVGWLSWAGESGGEVDLLPGSYRVRVSARGRDAGANGEFADGVVDFYLFEFWSAPSAPDAIVRVGSADARYWHTEWGNRR